MNALPRSRHLHRLIAATGEGGSTAFRPARFARASATVFVATEPGPKATATDRSISLFVEADGAWSLVGQTYGPDRLHLLASGHIDEMTGAPEGEVPA